GHPTEPLLRVRSLTLSINGTKLLHRIDLDLDPGECLAIVGASGAGKSLLARSVLGLTPRNALVDMDERTIGGWPTHDIGTDAALWRGIRGAIIGLVNQDALVSLDPLRRIGREVAEAYEIHTTQATRAEIALRVRKALVAAAMPQP
ncbi:MAG TPA: ATP-binding cassette domain-containing protein, partial [Terrimesophilobacter sp.]|nr:ATP-binding cassette domain-containing protein [Terrimesophilobacter sp.]